MKRLASSQQLELWSRGDEPLALIQYVDAVRSVRSHHGDSHQSPAVQIEMPCLGCGDIEPTPQLGNQRPYD